MRHTHNQETQRRAIIGKITALMQDLQMLAPHPDKPHNKGPLFIKSNSNFKAANDHDGMVGSMLMEGLLGTAFADAVSETLGSCAEDLDLDLNLDISSLMDAYSEYITDIEEKTQHIAAHGQGTLARMSGKSISGSFNLRGSMDTATQAFMDDMPKRMTIEKHLAYYAKQLEMIDNAATGYAIPEHRAIA